MNPDGGRGKTIIVLGGSTFIFDLPQSITYQTEYGWETAELGTAGLLYDQRQSFGGLGLNSDDIAAAASRAGSILGGAIDRAAMQTNVFNTGSISSKERRIAPNPKEAILFKGVTFRNYSLSFTIAGDSSAEVKEKAAYVNQMQVKAAPSLTGPEYFFTYPDTGTLEIKDDASNILKKRDIVITSIETDLTPNGYFATWSKGGPVTFNLTVGISELHLPTKKNDADILGFV